MKSTKKEPPVTKEREREGEGRERRGGREGKERRERGRERRGREEGGRGRKAKLNTTSYNPHFHHKQPCL